MLLWLMKIKQRYNIVILKVVRGSQEQPTSRARSALPNVYIFIHIYGTFSWLTWFYLMLILSISSRYYLGPKRHLMAFTSIVCILVFSDILLGLRCILTNLGIGPINIPGTNIYIYIFFFSDRRAFLYTYVSIYIVSGQHLSHIQGATQFNLDGKWYACYRD